MIEYDSWLMSRGEENMRFGFLDGFISSGGVRTDHFLRQVSVLCGWASPHPTKVNSFGYAS